MKNLYQHSIDLKKICIDNTDKDSFSQKLMNLPYRGYEVEELPQSQSIRSEGDGLQCKYMIQQQGNTILLNYVFHLKGYIFLSEQYKQLQELWAKVIEKNNALIVLKKI